MQIATISKGTGQACAGLVIKQILVAPAVVGTEGIATNVGQSYG